MGGMRALQQALPTWVQMERPPGQPGFSIEQKGGFQVITAWGFPEAPTTERRADVHFTLVAPTEGFPEREDLITAVKAALGDGEFVSMSAEDLAGGPSYITLGGWLGSQDLALMLIGAVEIAGISKAVTPAVFGMSGEMADQMAGMGMVMLGPSKVWGED